jgi:hypothetical protein
MDRFRWIVVAAVALAAVTVGIVSYNAGVSHGLAVAAAASDAPGRALPPYMFYGWYRPWGFGFFGPFAFVLFWFLLFRLFFWGSFRRRRWYYASRGDAPRAFDEWHRRAHERMKSEA